MAVRGRIARVFGHELGSCGVLQIPVVVSLHFDLESVVAERDADVGPHVVRVAHLAVEFHERRAHTAKPAQKCLRAGLLGLRVGWVAMGGLVPVLLPIVGVPGSYLNGKGAQSVQHQGGEVGGTCWRAPFECLGRLLRRRRAVFVIAPVYALVGGGARQGVLPSGEVWISEEVRQGGGGSAVRVTREDADAVTDEGGCFHGGRDDAFAQLVGIDDSADKADEEGRQLGAGLLDRKDGAFLRAEETGEVERACVPAAGAHERRSRGLERRSRDGASGGEPTAALARGNALLRQLLCD